MLLSFRLFLLLPEHPNIDQMAVSTHGWIESNHLSTKIQLLVYLLPISIWFFISTLCRDTFSLNLRRQLIDSSFHSFWSMHKSIKYCVYRKTSERFLTRLWIERSIVNHLHRHMSLCVSVSRSDVCECTFIAHTLVHFGSKFALTLANRYYGSIYGNLRHLVDSGTNTIKWFGISIGLVWNAYHLLSQM